MAVVNDDMVFHNVTTDERVEGATAFRAYVADIHDRWPDLGFEEHALYIATDTGVAEWTARATAADGRRLERDGIDVINRRDGSSQETPCTHPAIRHACSIPEDPICRRRCGIERLARVEPA
jgi:ketosteroid isomerase-like protein